MRRLALPLLLAISLGGCVQADGQYPSLLPRATEGQGMEEPERPAAEVAADPALDAKVTEATAGLDKARTEFSTAAQNAEAMVAVARGLPQGSDPWLEAQTALALLASKRAPVLNALQTLEGMAITRGEAGLAPYPAVDAAVAQVTELAEAQAARIATLEASLTAP